MKFTTQFNELYNKKSARNEIHYTNSRKFNTHILALQQFRGPSGHLPMRGIIFIALTTSDRKLEAPREGSKGRSYGTYTT
jgi:hypothetical protein